MRIRISRKNLAVPYFIFLVLFILIPILIIIYYAFTNAEGYFSWDALVAFFSSYTKLNVLLVSILIGLFNTFLCLLIGYPLAYLLSNKKFNKNYILVMLFVMPMWINFVLRTGALRDLLNWIGINTGSYPLTSTMIGMVSNYLPFTILPLYSTMLKLDQSQIEAASDLGCNPLQVFTKSIIPQTIPGIVSAAMMVFMPTMSSYVISDTLSEGKITLFGNSIYLSFTNSDWNGGSFMALIMLIIVFISMIFSHKFDKKEDVQRGSNI
ncbi:MAG: ABC transporter permease [Firmicutes bacterium]|nr:ABC transporter permease [Candidatus Alectryobacillus merdavium]